MQRDMDLIKAIIDHIHARTDVKPREVVIEGYDPSLVSRHLDILYQAGYLDATVSRRANGQVIFKVVDFTWDGHEFADTLKMQTVWEKTKAAMGRQFVSAPLKVVGDVAHKIAVDFVMSQITGG